MMPLSKQTAEFEESGGCRVTFVVENGPRAAEDMRASVADVLRMCRLIASAEELHEIRLIEYFSDAATDAALAEALARSGAHSLTLHHVEIDAALLCDALAHNPDLQMLEVDDCDYGRDMTPFLELSFNERSSLETLKLGGGMINFAGLRHSTKRRAACSLEWIRFNGCTLPERWDDDFMHFVAENTSVESLNFIKVPINERNFEHVLRCVAQNRKMSVLSMLDANIDYDVRATVCDMFERNHTLTRFNLSCNNISSAVAMAIGGFLEDRQQCAPRANPSAPSFTRKNLAVPGAYTKAARHR